MNSNLIDANKLMMRKASETGHIVKDGSFVQDSEKVSTMKFWSSIELMSLDSPSYGSQKFCPWQRTSNIWE
jgi:hypothetical protein